MWRNGAVLMILCKSVCKTLSHESAKPRNTTDADAIHSLFSSEAYESINFRSGKAYASSPPCRGAKFTPSSCKGEGWDGG